MHDLHVELIAMRGIPLHRVGRHQGAQPLSFVRLNKNFHFHTAI